ncbi:MAG: hypothetical protein MEQ84_13085 [Mesorhizobium sp.]|nr:hypothetical protein [Mesorhizobium sp.]
MKMRTPADTDLANAPAGQDTDDLLILLDEIEREQMPERLLTLAQQLQAALAAKRSHDGTEG